MNIYLVGPEISFRTITTARRNKLDEVIHSQNVLSTVDLKNIFDSFQSKEMKAFANLQSSSRWASDHGESESNEVCHAHLFIYHRHWELIRRPIFQVRVSSKRNGFHILDVQRIFINSISAHFDVLDLKAYTKKKILGKYIPGPLNGSNLLTRKQWFKVRLTILCIKRYLSPHPIAKISKDCIRIIFRLAESEISSNQWNCYRGSPQNKIDWAVSQWSGKNK